MKTKHKIALAKLAWRGVRTARAIQRAEMIGDFRRGGLYWHLDLNEGIDFSIFLLGAFERATVRFYQKAVRPGEVVLDIGANVGAHTLPFAKCVGQSGKVFAFEATEFAYRKLVRNISLNRELIPIVVPKHMMLVAPGECNAPEKIYSSWPLNPVGEVHEKHLGQLQPLGGAKVETLDSFCAAHEIQRLDWVKLDVDGNETSVLRGALDTLRRFRPRLITELSPYVCREAGYRFDGLVNLIRSADYGFYDLETGQELPSQATELDLMIPDGSGLNVLLKPLSGI